MFDSSLENRLILPDIVDRMVDYVSIQIDIDERKVKAAALVAQNIDIKRLITKDNLDRIIDMDESASDADKELLELLIPPLCYFTYSRCLLMFQGSFTDSGYHIEDEGEARNAAKSVSKEMKSIAESFMIEVIEFLESENPNTEANSDKLTPRVRIFGGQENRSSN